MYVLTGDSSQSPAMTALLAATKRLSTEEETNQLAQVFRIDLSQYSEVVDDAFVKQVCLYAPNLTEVCLAGLYEITDHVFEYLGRLPGLKQVDISDTLLVRPDLQKLTNLEQLRMKGCVTLLTVNLDGLKQLDAINLSGCSKLTNVHGTGRGKITTINFSGCGQLTTELEKYHSASTLSLGSCPQVTDNEIYKCIEMTRLESLYIHGCLSITVGGVSYIKRNPSVTRIGLDANVMAGLDGGKWFKVIIVDGHECYMDEDGDARPPSPPSPPCAPNNADPHSHPDSPNHPDAPPYEANSPSYSPISPGFSPSSP